MTIEATGETWYKGPEDSEGKFTSVDRILDGEFDRRASVDFYHIFCLDGRRATIDIKNCSYGLIWNTSGTDAYRIKVIVDGKINKDGRGKLIGEGHILEAEISGKGHVRISWTDPQRKRR